jgi:hypothetical protein
VVVKIEGACVPSTYKVFACWYGGYARGDSWKLNSGVVKAFKKSGCYCFEGFSGSTYICHEKSYGMNLYGNGVLNAIINRSEEVGVKVEIMPESTDWLGLSYT